MEAPEPQQPDDHPKDPSLRKKNSYTYWVNSDPAHKQSFPQDTAPKPVTAPLPPSTGDGPSHWNKAGTWSSPHQVGKEPGSRPSPQSTPGRTLKG
jgi:hypothetical protein